MDLALLTPWIAAALSIIALLAHAKTFFGSEGKAAAAELGKLKTTVDEQGKRLQAVESELRHLPDQAAVTGLMVAMEKLNGTVTGLSERVNATNQTVIRIDAFLAKNAQ